MRLLLILITLLLTPSLAHADDVNQQIIEENVTFLSFHDPGWLALKDEAGNEIEAASIAAAMRKECAIFLMNFFE